MYKITTLKINHNNGEYAHISLFDSMKEIVFNSGFVEIDFAICIYFAKQHYHIINYHQSVHDFMTLNDDRYYWQHTIYGEFIVKNDCEKEMV